MKKISLRIALVFCLASVLALSGCERNAWNKARKAHTIEAFENYLREYPDGGHTAEAWAFIERLSFRAAMQKNTPDALRDFIRNFPDSDYKEKATTRIKDLIRAKADGFSVEQIEAARVVVETSQGNFTMRLFVKEAPIAGRNLVYLALLGFYDNMQIHRVVKDTLVQMGDPRGDGFGGPGYMIPMEINRKSHVRGAVSMWHSPVDPDTAGSQFFVCLVDMPGLDGVFTVFAEVVDGLDVLDQISQVETTGPEDKPPYRPLSPIIINKISVTGIDIEW